MKTKTLLPTLLLCALPALSVSFVGTDSAFAQTEATPSPDAVAKAQDLYEKGINLFNKNKFEQALEEFRASYAAVASPNSHLSIARCLAKLERLQEAYLEYDATAEEAGAKAVTEERYAKTRDTAAQERDDLGKKMALVTVTVDHADSAISLTIAGKDVPRDRWGKPYPVMPGNADVSVSTASGTPVTQSLTLSAGDTKNVSLDANPAPTTTEPIVEASTSSRKGLRPFAYIAGGIGVAGLGLFTIAGIMTNSTYSDLEETCNGPCPANRASDVSAGKTQQTLANIGLIVGAVGIAAGTTLFILSLGGDSKEKEAEPSTISKSQLVVGPGFASIRGQF